MCVPFPISITIRGKFLEQTKMANLANTVESHLLILLPLEPDLAKGSRTRGNHG